MILRLKKAFTLIELLIVIGIMAVIAAGVVALIDPVEKTRQANDANFQSIVGNFATAAQSYAAQQTDGAYPSAWATDATNVLVTTGEMPLYPAMPSASYSVAMVRDAATGNINLWGPVLSKKYTTKCTAPARAIWFWASTNGRACGGCAAAAPAYNQACVF